MVQLTRPSNVRRPWPLALVLLVIASVLRTASVSAHAHYDHSSPAIGQVLAAAPARVDIFTDSEMRKLADANQITVTGPDGNRVDDGATVVDDANRKHFFVGLKPTLGPGRYLVSFQTLSDADGETDHGRFAFYVGSGPTAEQKALDAKLASAGPASADSASGDGHGLPFLIWGAMGVGVAALLAGLLIAVRVARRRSARA